MENQEQHNDGFVVVYPPNKPYHKVLTPSKAPVRYNFMGFIDSNEKGEIVVGSSNLTGALWEGTLQLYKNYDAAVNDAYSMYYISSCPIADAKFVKNTSYVILAEDSGQLKLLNHAEGVQRFKCEDAVSASARLEQLAVWENSYKAVTCAEATIAIWDMQNNNIVKSIKEYKYYHTDLITSVDVNHNNLDLFASASMDRKACMWDLRLSLPTTVLHHNEFAGLTSISWNPENGNVIVVGSLTGYIYNLDIRQPNEFLNSYHCFDAYIHRVVFNKTGHLAVCGDTEKLMVLKVKDGFQSVYENDDHSAYVRGLTWYNDVLYSCGFDKRVLKHVF